MTDQDHKAAARQAVIPSLIGGVLGAVAYILIIDAFDTLLFAWIFFFLVLIGIIYWFERRLQHWAIITLFHKLINIILYAASCFQLTLALLMTIYPSFFEGVMRNAGKTGTFDWYLNKWIPQSNLLEMYREHNLELLWRAYRIYNISAIFADAATLICLVLFVWCMRVRLSHASPEIYKYLSSLQYKISHTTAVCSGLILLSMYIFTVFL